MTSAPLPLVVIGGGSIGLRHATLAHNSPQITLCAVVERDPIRRNELSDFGLPVVADIAEAPDQTQAAIIATPTGQHAESGLAALARGWAVLVEKPIAGTLDDTDRLLAAAQQMGVPLFVGHHRRCHPFVATARERIARIGKIVAVQGLWSLRKHDSYFDTAWRNTAGSGPLLTNLSHEIDLLRHLVGEISHVSALASNTVRGGALEDTASIQFHFENGALGNFLISDAGLSPWAFEAATGENPDLAASRQDCLRVIGTTGSLSFPSCTLWRGSKDNANWRDTLAAEPAPPLDPVDPLAEQMHRFARRLGGDQAADLVSGQDGRGTLAATLAAALSGATHQTVRPSDVAGDYAGWDTEQETILQARALS